MPISKAELKKTKALLTRKGRRSQGRFIGEGIRLLDEALHHRFLPIVVYYAESLLSERGRDLLGRLQEYEVPASAVSARELESLSHTKAPQGVVAVFETPTVDLGKLFRPDFRTVLWCHHVADPLNLGLLLRSAAAFGIDLVVTSGDSVELFAPRTVRASAGAVFAVPVATAAWEEISNLLREHNFCVLATDIHGREFRTLADVAEPEQKLALVVGSEADGLPVEIINRAETVLRIAHENRVESLNVAVAGSILMREVYEFRKA